MFRHSRKCLDSGKCFVPMGHRRIAAVAKIVLLFFFLLIVQSDVIHYLPCSSA